MISRINFLKGAAVALVVPLPSLVLGEAKTIDTDFTLTAVEVRRCEMDFGYTLRCLAVSDKPILGKTRTAYFAAKYLPEVQSLENLIEKELKPMIQSYFKNKIRKSYFKNKIRSGAWT